MALSFCSFALLNTCTVFHNSSHCDGNTPKLAVLDLFAAVEGRSLVAELTIPTP
jgi:hypothetical protein